MKKKKGITLIALIVTIIVLLILAGVSLNLVAGENGILGRATSSVNKNQEATAREIIEMKIMEYQMYARSEGLTPTLYGLKEYYYDDKEIETILLYDQTDEIVNNEVDQIEYAEIKLKDYEYIYTINKNLLIENRVKRANIKAEYEIVSKQNTIYTVNLKIESNKNIEKIRLPDNTEKKAESENQKIFYINDYQIGENEERIFNIKLKEIEESIEYTLKIEDYDIIIDSEIKEYPMLSKEKEEVEKNISKIAIDFGEYTNNYYSLDNGENWKKYEGPIQIEEEITIKAKTIVDNKFSFVKTQAIRKASAVQDAIGEEAYDGNLETWAVALDKYVKLADNLQDYTVNITLYCPAYNHINVHFYQEDKTTRITGAGGYWHTMHGKGVLQVKIPANAKWLKFTTVQGHSDLCYVYNINLNTKPIGDETRLYPYIDDKGLHNDEKYQIKYFESAVKKLYSMDNVNWRDYPEGGIELSYGETVYAKSINSKGRESDTLTYTHNLPDILGENAYDGNLSTFFQCQPYRESGDTRLEAIYYIDIKPEAQGKEVYLKFIARYWSRYDFYVYDKEGNKTKWLSLANEGNQETTKMLPEDAVKLEIKYVDGSAGIGEFYEMKIK